MPIGANPPPVYAPPTAPAVASQQAGPMAQFMSQQQGGPGGGAGQPGVDAPMQMVEQVLNDIALKLRDVARILIMSKPMLMPVLQKMIQSGSMLMDEIQKANSGQDQQGTGGSSEAAQAGGGPDGGASPTAQ